MRLAAGLRPRVWWAVGLAGCAVLTAMLLARRSAAADPAVPTAAVSRGAFVEWLELRGEIQPLRSVTLTAPSDAGDLQLLQLVDSGGAVHEGDVVVRFDGSTIERTIQEKQSDVARAAADVDQARAKARIAEEKSRTALLQAQHDVDRARLEAGAEDLAARLDVERARLSLADAEQRLREAELRAEADRASAEAEIAKLERQREKAQADLDRAVGSRQELQILAPADGVVHLLPNPRSGTPMSPPQDFREGDRAWAGAAIAALPDLSVVFFTAQVEESDRGRLGPGRPAEIRVEAIPDRAFDAMLEDISVLARVDFRAGFPPPRNFDVRMRLTDTDARVRPGMSATARIALDRLDNVLTVPADALFLVDGAPAVYRLHGSRFVVTPVEVLRRSRTEVAIASGVAEGDRVAAAEPPPEARER